MELNILGDRLKKIRESLELSQIDVASNVDCYQNAISNLELGKGGSITLFLQLISYYSQFVYIDMLFADNFYFIPKVQGEGEKSSHWMAIDALKYAKNELIDKTTEALKNFASNVDKATELMI